METNLQTFRQNFAINNKVEVVYGVNQQVMLMVNTPWSNAEIYLQGAHLTAFRKNKQADLIWLSPIAEYHTGKAIRGGIPLCWPWFGKLKYAPHLPQHGFARTSLFEIKQVNELADGDIQISLQLCDSADTLEIWPYRFRLEVVFTIGQSLTIEMTTINCDQQPFAISEAIHSYFQVDDIHRTRLIGLNDDEYYNQLNRLKEVQLGVLVIDQEVDRIYQTNDRPIRLACQNECEEQPSSILIEQKNANSTVVWNPWIEKSSLMADFPDDGYLNMLCVEAANTGAGVQIEPGQRHTLSQIIGIQ